MGASVPNPADVRIGVAVTTVGRWDRFASYSSDLAAQSLRPRAVAIAHHDPADNADLDALVESFADTLEIITVVSPCGISNGRNAAAATFGDDVEWLWFPNDTSRIDADFLERVSRHLSLQQPCALCRWSIGKVQGIHFPPRVQGDPAHCLGSDGAGDPIQARRIRRGRRIQPGPGLGGRFSVAVR